MDFSKDDLLKLEHAVADLVKALGSPLTKEWQNAQDVSFKEHREPVTKFDVQIEKDLREELKKLLPEAGFIVEEGDNAEGNDYSWVIDPIDQTRNFVAQVPIFYVQVALIYKDDPILGVIYNPVSEQLFSASKGNGTKLNTHLLPKRVVNRLSQAVVDIDFGGGDQGLAWRVMAVQKLTELVSRVRMSGAAFAPYIVTGAIDAFVVLNEQTKIVDQMPRIIIAREAGLQSETLHINTHKVIITADLPVFEEIKEILSKI